MSASSYLVAVVGDTHRSSALRVDAAIALVKHATGSDRDAGVAYLRALVEHTTPGEPTERSRSAIALLEAGLNERPVFRLDTPGAGFGVGRLVSFAELSPDEQRRLQGGK